MRHRLRAAFDQLAVNRHDLAIDLVRLADLPLDGEQPLDRQAKQRGALLQVRRQNVPVSAGEARQARAVELALMQRALRIVEVACAT